MHKETLLRLFRAGKVPAYKVGRVLRWDVDEIKAALRTTPSAGACTAAVSPNFDALEVRP